jgi:hypothetical protein
MTSAARLNRQKISTTVSPRTLEFLEGLTRSGESRTLAEAIDLAIEKLLVYENRERLANDTAAYFANLTESEVAEEQRLEQALSQTSEGIDFDQ